jgi:putative ABC transport system permease protein
MNPDGLLAMRVRLDPPNYVDDDARQRKVDAILERLTSLRGVMSAAATAGFVIEGEPVRQFAIEGRPQATPGDVPWANEAAVTADYWRACEIPLLDGRTWQASDRAVAWNVAIVNREAARRYWPSRSPIGQRIAVLDAKGQPSGAPLEIVGVAGNVIGSEPTDPAPPRIYRPLATRPFESVGFLVRGSGDVTGLVTPVREALRSEDRDLAVSDVRPARTQLDAYLRSWDLILSLFAGFAAIGLVVALTGVYGVTAFSVGQRRHEIGVRLALGATPPQVLRLIAARTFRLMAMGVVFGVAGGWAIGLAMRGILYGVAATDPATYLAGLLLITFCGIAATVVPAMRVMSIEPMLVLKRD